VTRNRIKARVKPGTKPETEEKLHFTSVVPKPRRKTESGYIIMIFIPLGTAVAQCLRH
jgi:hypothetical protein